MSRIHDCFSRLKASHKKALIPYIMAGDPNPDVTVALMHGMAENGADIIELGMPFSDPMADGPVIALAAERALAGHTSTLDVFTIVRRFRETDSTTPVVLMGYLNPVEITGYENFARLAAEAGVDGLLVVDLPPEEAGRLDSLLARHDIAPIFLIAPTTTSERIDKIVKMATGYIYYVSLKGVTGSAVADYEEVKSRISAIKARTDIPVGVGFGISNGEIARNFAKAADAVIVGTALVKELDTGNIAAGQQAILGKIREIRQALDQ